MKCKNHASDVSSVVGVCASCLRDRLLSLIAARAELQSEDISAAVVTGEDDLRSSPVPEKQNLACDQRFFRTPQIVAPATVSAVCKNSRGKFSLFSSVFRSGRGKSGSDLKVSSDSWCGSSSSSPSLLSTVIGKKPWKIDPGEDLQSVNGCPPEVWRSPANPRRRQNQNHRNIHVSSLTFCLSPLVRASPSRQWNHRSTPASDFGVSGEIRVSSKPQPSSVSSLYPNKSRKLADFGRLKHNHCS